MDYTLQLHHFFKGFWDAKIQAVLCSKGKGFIIIPQQIVTLSANSAFL